MKTKTWTYCVNATFDYNIEDEIIHKSYMTQLYQIGIYIIWNNDSSQQGSMTPSGMSRIKKSLIKDEKLGNINNLVLGREIKVIKINGFYTEIKE